MKQIIFKLHNYDPIISCKLEMDGWKNSRSKIKYNINIIVHGHAGTFVSGSTLRVRYLISLLYLAGIQQAKKCLKIIYPKKNLK